MRAGHGPNRLTTPNPKSDFPDKGITAPTSPVRMGRPVFALAANAAAEAIAVIHESKLHSDELDRRNGYFYNPLPQTPPACGSGDVRLRGRW